MSHQYTFVPGMKPTKTTKPRRATTNEAITLLMTDEWKGVLRFDEFRRVIVAVNPPVALEAETTKLTDADLIAISAWFNFKCRIAGSETVAQAALVVARRQPFHPILDYLDACKPGPPLLDTLASRVFGCTPGIADEFLKRTLVGAVRRLRKPGCRMDTTLVICGKQGLKKSTSVEELFGEDFTRSQMPDLGGKDASVALAGFWAVELAELDRIIRAETSTVKEFLTRKYDDYRAPYGRTDERYPRQVVFVGTSNDEDFLRDATGNRRFWPIVATKVDVELIRANRDAIWAEASALEAAGFPHWFDEKDEARAEAAREIHVVESPYHERVAAYCRGKDWVHSDDCYDQAIAKGNALLVAQKSRRETMGVADTLKRLGCTRQSKFNRKGWAVPNALKEGVASKEDQEAQEAAASASDLKKFVNWVNGSN